MKAGNGGKGEKKFTLLELLVVISIMVILLSLLLPGLREARNATYSTVCKNNLKQLGLGCQLYAGENGEFLPFAQSPNGTRWLSTVAACINSQAGWNFAWTKTTPLSTRNLFVCPSGNEQLYCGANYLYNKWCGNYEATWGYPTVPQCVSKKINKVANPSKALLIGDGQSKRYSALVGDYPVWFDLRHQNKVNILWVDGHASPITQPEFESLNAAAWMRYAQ